MIDLERAAVLLATLLAAASGARDRAFAIPLILGIPVAGAPRLASETIVLGGVIAAVGGAISRSTADTARGAPSATRSRADRAGAARRHARATTRAWTREGAHGARLSRARLTSWRACHRSRCAASSARRRSSSSRCARSSPRLWQTVQSPVFGLVISRAAHDGQISSSSRRRRASRASAETRPDRAPARSSRRSEMLRGCPRTSPRRLPGRRSEILRRFAADFTDDVERPSSRAISSAPSEA